MNNKLTSSLFCQFLSFSQVFVVYIMHFISDFCSSGYYIPFSLPFSRIIAPQSLYCDWQLWYKNNHFFWLSTAFSQYCDKKRNRQWSTFLQNQFLYLFLQKTLTHFYAIMHISGSEFFPRVQKSCQLLDQKWEMLANIWKLKKISYCMHQNPLSGCF